MAFIGMRYLVAAPVTDYTEGSEITYGPGFVIGPAAAANLTYQVNDNPDFGDDVELNNDIGVNGYNGTVDANHIEDNIKANLFGWETIGTTDFEYEQTDQEPPLHGWGFMRVLLKPNSNTPYYECKWFHLARFSQQNLTASTKQRQITWNHPQMNVNGIGAHIDNSGKAKWFRHKTFDNFADAKAWMNAKAGITAATT